MCELSLFKLFWAFALSLSVSGEEYLYKIEHFDVPLDHFGYAVDHSFQIRYLVNDSYANGNSPILFYTGNEGDIELFAKNTGFMWEIAPILKAKLVFAEHRYYGKSLPFNNSFETPAQFGYLTAEQALADYADLIMSLNPERNRPVIAIGGSYGGMLAAWFRMKYPHLIEGSLASSAPILQFEGLTPCGIYSRITSSVFSIAYNKNCSINVKKSWETMQNMLAKEDGKQFLNEKFKFCKPLNNTNDLSKFFDYLQDVYGNLAMINYPYETNFLAPVPANPVRQFCGQLKDTLQGRELINALYQAVSVYSNYTGKLHCLDVNSADGALDASGWDIQTCTEMVMPMCSNGKDDMFQKADWNLTDYTKVCQDKFKVKPRVNAIKTMFGGKKLRWTSNIIFSNGLLDPWSGGGVLSTTNNKVQVLIIPDSAHHLDLRARNPNDPDSIRQARDIELRTIKSWIYNYRRKV